MSGPQGTKAAKLPRIALITLIGIASTVSVTFPAWSRVLQIEGYGDYVDLQATVTVPADWAYAGMPIELTVHAMNAGPQTAEYPQLTISPDPALNLSASTGCVESPTFDRRCTLTQALGPGANAQSSMSGQVDPDARGIAIVGVFAGSEAIDVVPGNELSVIAVPIYARRDLSARMVSEAPVYDERGRPFWEVAFANAGPSSARSVAISLNGFGFGGGNVYYACRNVGAAACPTLPDMSDAYLAPGSSLIYTVTMPPLSESNPALSLQGSVSSIDGVEDGFMPNVVFLLYGDRLFSDGIESQ